MFERPGTTQYIPDLPERVITNCSPEFSASQLADMTITPASGPWFGANSAVAYPFRMSYPVIAKQLCIYNGSAAGGQVDLGLYDSAFVRLASTGSTGGTGNNLWQFIDITDVTLLAGKLYYLAAARDNTTANRQRFGGNGGAPGGILTGTLSGASQFPLPDPLVVSTNTVTSTQFVGIVCKIPFA